ncbi:hypothetical protein ABPG75_001928 [Micractinium tetrahymenae]
MQCSPRRLTAAAPLLVAVALAAALSQATAEYSQLWGRSGEKWRPNSRIVDQSRAGYGAGALTLPAYNLTFDVKRPHLGFGNAGRAGATVYIPPGTYRITKMLELTQSNVVVKGAGRGRTVLYFPKGLRRIYGDQMEWQWSGGFLAAVGPEINSTHTDYKLASMTAKAVKGQRRLAVSNTTGIAVGQWVRLWASNPLKTRRGHSLLKAPAVTEQGRAAALGAQAERVAALRTNARRLQATADGFLPLSPAMEEAWRQAQACHVCTLLCFLPVACLLGRTGPGAGPARAPGAAIRGVGIASADGTLDAYIFGENMVSSGSEPFPLERIRFVSRVTKKGLKWIELERPLLYDLRLEWEPGVYSFEQAVQHSGWEDFTVNFAWTPYPSHFVVEGMNGFWFSGTANCWVRNVDIINADTGGEAINSDFVTMSDIKLWHTARRTGSGMQKGANGHHGLWAAHSSNVVITQANFSTMFIHDLTMDVWAEECVFKNSRGIDLNMDMHRGGPHNNLWSNLDLGKGLRAFASSGSSIRGAHAAANNTWWNIKSARGTINIPECGFGPYLTFVGPSWGYPDNKAAGVNAQLAAAAAANDSAIGAAGVQSYCPQNRWYTEVVRNLAPTDLHAAMRDTRRLRIGIP